MSIVPDTKDWTWVLRERCAECGLEAAAVDAHGVAALVRESLPRWRKVLARPDVSVRPDLGPWSDLEYGCHVRDVFTLFDERLALMLTSESADGEGARFAN